MISAPALLRDLLRCASVTPADAGAQGVLISALEGLGFEITKLRFGEIQNFFAERAGPGRHLCFAGHT
ncbi:MAG: succinyl-diaminopimelate desuccinylase, partial [Rhodospirillales bacterium]|nr:succinyl-diaminopimelate desuccinylase [Rhodospirillales bacterium]